MTGKGSLRHLQIQRQLWLPFVNSDRETAIATAQQAAVTDILTTTSSLWTFAISDVNTGEHGLPFEQLDAVHHIRNDYYQPYIIDSCANDTIESLNDEQPLTFPTPPTFCHKIFQNSK